MAVVSVSAQNTRLDDASSLTDWGIIGGGAGATVETDYSYQGGSCISRKGASSQRGIYLSDNVDTNIASGTYKTIMVKCIVTTPGLLDSLSTPGMVLRIGSGSTPTTESSNYYRYAIQGSDTYPLDKSWLVVPINPNIVAHRTGTVGSPNLSAYDFTGLLVDQSSVSKAENYALDAVDIGAGLTLVGGDGASADGVWKDFSDYDWGTPSNRFGYVRVNEGIYLVYGTLKIGSASATVFNDSARTIVFPDGLFGAGFSGISVDLQSATTDVDFTTTTFLGRGTSTGEETRPILTVTGTSGTFDANKCTFDNFAGLTLTSKATLTNCTISSSKLLTQSSGSIISCNIFGATTAGGTAFILSNDPSKISDTEFTFSDGHAIEITTAGTYTFIGNKFTGYGTANDAAIYNNSGGLVTLNVTGGGDTPTIRNGAGASTVVNNNTSVTITGLPGTSVEIRVYENAGTQSAPVAGSELAGQEDVSTSTFNFSASASSEVILVINDEDFLPVYIPYTIPTLDTSLPFSLIKDRVYLNP